MEVPYRGSKQEFLGGSRAYGIQTGWGTPIHSMKTRDRLSLFMRDGAPWINTVKS